MKPELRKTELTKKEAMTLSKINKPVFLQKVKWAYLRGWIIVQYNDKERMVVYRLKMRKDVER